MHPCLALLPLTSAGYPKRCPHAPSLPASHPDLVSVAPLTGSLALPSVCCTWCPPLHPAWTQTRVGTVTCLPCQRVCVSFLSPRAPRCFSPLSLSAPYKPHGVDLVTSALTAPSPAPQKPLCSQHDHCRCSRPHSWPSKAILALSFPAVPPSPCLAAVQEAVCPPVLKPSAVCWVQILGVQ